MKICRLGFQARVKKQYLLPLNFEPIFKIHSRNEYVEKIIALTSVFYTNRNFSINRTKPLHRRRIFPAECSAGRSALHYLCSGHRTLETLWRQSLQNGLL